MRGYSKLPKKQMYLILISCAIIIFAASLEVMMRVKDINIFNQWLLDIDFEQGIYFSQEELFNAFLAANLSYFFLSVIIPMGYGIHTYFAYTKLRISGLFVGVWTVLSLGGLAYTVIEMNFFSVFFYVRIIGYIILLITTISLTEVLNEDKLE